MNFVPYSRQTITNDDIAAVEEVLRSSHLTQGPAVEKFEVDFAALHAVDHAPGTGAIDLEHVGEFGLAGARPAIEPRQHQPLGAGEPDVAHAAVEHGADQPRNVGEHVADVFVVVGAQGYSLEIVA